LKREILFVYLLFEFVSMAPVTRICVLKKQSRATGRFAFSPDILPRFHGMVVLYLFPPLSKGGRIGSLPEGIGRVVLKGKSGAGRISSGKHEDSPCKLGIRRRTWIVFLKVAFVWVQWRVKVDEEVGGCVA